MNIRNIFILVTGVVNLLPNDKVKAGHDTEAPLLTAPTVNGRQAEYPVDPEFLQRQSRYDLHRTLTPEHMREKLMSCFEAARWAASGGNGQPWRFVFAIHGTESWDRIFNLLAPKNQEWAKNAGALVVVVSNTLKEHNGKPCKSHSFDAGLAVSNLFMQATKLGLVTHPLGGFDQEKAYTDLNIPADYALEIIIAVGEKALADQGSIDYAEKDSKPSQRKSLSEITFEGEMPLS